MKQAVRSECSLFEPLAVGENSEFHGLDACLARSDIR